MTYSAADGVSFSSGIKPTLFHDRLGTVHVAFERNLNVRHGEHFVAVRPSVPGTTHATAWGWHQTVLQDHTGEWWIATGEGLARFPKGTVDQLAAARPLALYTTRDGLRTNDVFRIFEDHRGGIWVACIGPSGVNGLSRWDPANRRFQSVPAHDSTAASAFAEDAAGDVWIGYYDGTLARYRDGNAAIFTQRDGLAGGGILALHVDHGHRLWIASTGGLTRVTGIETPHPDFAPFGTQHGLSSNMVVCLDEDQRGVLYVATSRGIDAITTNEDVEPARVRHYSEADGLAHGEIRDVLFDRDGVLWCATTQGISRLVPEVESAVPPLPVLLRELRVRGVPVSLWDLGTPYVSHVTLEPDQNQLEVAFSAATFARDRPRYQYRLDPADGQWSSPTSLRSVNYSNVAPGKYRFQVRLMPWGHAAMAPAVLEFQVLAPVWARGWFRPLLMAMGAALLFWLHRFRTMQLLKFERIRTRIATDLHDDIGSGLSQIAILSEVARATARRQAGGLEGTLVDIGSLSRELSESMNDIVWSVNPRRDHAHDLTQRMRRFASDVLAGSNIEFTFRPGFPEETIVLSPEMRREVYLIFKEAVNNIARHSESTCVQIEISISAQTLELRVEDNGNRVGKGCGGAGLGLENMRSRARAIGGHIEFGCGTLGGRQVLLRAPVRMRRFST
jgi:signal transduction histidine kinase/streptogramin lyase